jgi:type IV pilus assembly protein PilY1
MDNTATTSRRAPVLRMQPLALGLAVSLLAAPVNATITLPDDPLTTSSRVAPNILFILDDSGSMGAPTMYNPSVSAVSGDSSVRARSYATNTIFYNPFTTYQAWLRADGSRSTDGTRYTRAFMHFDNAELPIDLGDATSCNSSNNNGSLQQVCGGEQTFYVPKDPDNTSATYLSNAANYYRYQIRTDGRVFRSEWLPRSGSSPGYNNGDVGGGCRTTDNVTTWRRCTHITPSGRTDQEERDNYATWFSYHRTRMKVAKAGASEAFGALDGQVRVGFRTLFERDRDQRTALDIPVGDGNDGRFMDVTGSSSARTNWYNRLHSIRNNSTTPLRTALAAAGNYFSRTDSAGPYGPGSSQYACRQNFAILTTDGEWNDNYSGTGNADGSNGSLISDPTGRTYRYTPSNPYSDNRSNTLADVAMHYWKTDLRTDLVNNVPTTQVNPAFWQHMVTFGISIGLTGQKGWSSVNEVPDNPNWGDPIGSSSARIDDLLHAALNSRGEFVAASDPDQFRTGLSRALAAITERTGSFSNVAANSTSVDGGTRLYQASYVSGVWNGEVVAFPVGTDGVVGLTPSWRASSGIPTTGRKIFTGDDAGTAAVEFPSGISRGRLSLLARTGVANYPVTGADNAAYLAGNRSQELSNGGELRNRSSLLGDIVSSSPAYVRDTETLYIGGNDGMLHAFNATNGREVFAYIPGGISWSDLATLSRQDYNHKYFVDGPISVSTRDLTPGRNILVGALGKGGKGLYALDVSSPASFSANNFKWEVRGNHELMGLVQSKPIITRLNNGVEAVIVANGINSTSGRAGLFIYNLDTGALISALDTQQGSATVDSPNSNGLTSAVGWDADGNGTVDYVYGGDMLGNVWKFDISSGSSATWSIAGNGSPLFTATDAQGGRQPITGGLTLALHPRTYQPWLFFGTGRLMVSDDMASTTVQSLYGLVDDGSAKIRNGANANLTSRRTVVSGNINGMPVRSFEAQQALPAGSKGWYLDLLEPGTQPVAAGERVISDAQLFGDVLIVSTVIPTADACQADGRGYLNALDAFTGTSTGPSLFDLDGDGSYDDETLGSGNNQLPVGSVDLGVGMPTLAEVLRGLAVVGGSSGNLGNVRIRETRNVGRVSWREVLTN